MKNLLLIIFSLVLYSTFSQNWNINNQHCLGGSLNDGVEGSFLLSNGNTLIYGTSNSGISGDKTEVNIGGIDIWLISVDNNFQIIWQKTIGGVLDDYISKIIETKDHNLLVLSYSDSPLGGMKTSPNYGANDIWLLKLDLNGGIIWDKTFGGIDSENSNDILELESENIIITSTSYSGVSGNKTSENIGQSDIWIIKIDSNGQILSDISIGGVEMEAQGNITKINEKEFWLTSYSESNTSINKSENSYGSSDFWICKMDTNSIILIEKTIGGTEEDSGPKTNILNDGNILVSGMSMSPISGLKTENSFNFSFDCWFVKLDQTLNIITQKTIGSNNTESPKTINQLSNNKILIGTQSDSDVNIFKSEPNKGNGIGSEDLWFFTLDENLMFLEDKTIGSTSRENLSAIIENTPYNFTVFSTSKGINTADKTCSGNNTASWNSPSDFWVFNLNTTLGLDENTSNENLTIFPNPVLNIFTVNSENIISSLEVLTLEGKMVQQKEVNNTNSSMNVEMLPSGIYLCKLLLENEEISIVRFVKE